MISEMLRLGLRSGTRPTASWSQDMHGVIRAEGPLRPQEDGIRQSRDGQSISARAQQDLFLGDASRVGSRIHFAVPVLGSDRTSRYKGFDLLGND